MIVEWRQFPVFGGKEVMKIIINIVLCILLGAAGAVAQVGLPPNAPPPPDRLTEAMRTADMNALGEGKYRLGEVLIDQTKKELALKGMVNLNSGPMELIACATGGRTHESVLIMDVEPIHLQTSLLLIGLQPGRNIRWEGDTRVPEGSGVIIEVTWELGGIEHIYRAEDLVMDVTSKKTMPHTAWIFTGSQIINGRFMAQEEKSLITTYRFPYTIIDNPLPSGTDDELYVANTLLLPPVGTPVNMIITAAESEKGKTDESEE